uniref:Uncharacterized protein n=1 Tax=Caenorhabditis japonica TaxID=281687 RepID=A0A8R1EF51_CAEJA
MKFFIFLSLVGTLFAFSQKINTIINDKKINEKNTVKVEKINEGSAKLTNFHFGDDGEYIYYPSSEDKDQADAETHFFFVVPGPPTTKKP